jgi:PKD repeat protein
MYLSSDTYCPGSQVDLSVSLYDEKLSYFILHTGDGKSTGLDEFSYVYSDTGEYTIMAIGENSCGIDTFTTKINIGNDMDNRPFIYSRNVTCVGRASELFLGSQNESFASATVDFGDSTQIDTIWDMTTPFFHSYKKGGSYTVLAIFTYTNCAQPDTITTKVTVLARPNVFPFSVYVSSTNLCPKEVNINGPSISEGDTLIYDLGDGTFLKFADERPNLTHSYNSTGTYEIKIHRITVCDTFYNRDSASITVTVSDNLKTNLYLSANYSTKELLSCLGDSFTLRMENSQHPFTNPTFTLPDGSRVSGEALTTAFDQVGTYPIIVSATNYCGVEMKSAYTVELTDKTMNPSLSGYSYPRAQCINQLFLFDMFTENATNMLWEFGDGNWIENPEGPHVQHLYTEPGTYTVKVTASNGCGETIKNTTLFVEPGPKVDFTASKTEILKGESVNFTNQSTG